MRFFSRLLFPYRCIASLVSCMAWWGLQVRHSRYSWFLLCCLSVAWFAKMAKVGVVANVGLKRGFCDFCSRGSRACGMRPGLVSLSAPAAEPLACGRIILFYLLCGIIAGAVLFLKPLNGADAFISTYDNLYHYNALRALVESGYWSPLGTSCYLALPMA